MSLGSIVRQRRLALNITQEDIEKQAGVTREWVSLVERGKIKQPSWENLRNLARVLELDATELLREAGYSLNVPGISEDEAQALYSELIEIETSIARFKKRLIGLTQPKNEEPAGEADQRKSRKLVARPRPGGRDQLVGVA